MCAFCEIYIAISYYKFFFMHILRFKWLSFSLILLLNDGRIIVFPQKIDYAQLNLKPIKISAKNNFEFLESYIFIFLPNFCILKRITLEIKMMMQKWVCQCLCCMHSISVCLLTHINPMRYCTLWPLHYYAKKRVNHVQSSIHAKV